MSKKVDDSMLFHIWKEGVINGSVAGMVRGRYSQSEQYAQTELLTPKVREHLNTPEALKELQDIFDRDILDIYFPSPRSTSRESTES